MLPIDGFKANIHRVRELGGLYLALNSLTTKIINADDILRSQLVMAVSALDYYIHEVVRKGILDIFSGKRPVVAGIKSFQVSLVDAQSAIASGSHQWVDETIRLKHSYLSFQHPDKIADAIRLIYPDPIWPKIEHRLTIPVKTLKDTLRLIVDRRNKIAHEADMDPSFPGARWPISKPDVDRAIEFLDRLCEAIDAEVS